MRYLFAVAGLLLLCGATFVQPVTVTGTSGGGGGGPTVQVNGSSTGATVTAGATMTVSVTNGPGNAYDWLAIVDGNYNPQYNMWGVNIDRLGSYWIYLANCSTTAPGGGTANHSCPVTAPALNGSYSIALFPNNGFTAVALAPLTVTGGSGQAITAVFVSPASFVAPGVFSGSLTAICTVTCPAAPSYALATSGSCATNNNGSFQPISGATLAGNGSLTAGTYVAGVQVTIPGTSNSGTCFSVTVTGSSDGSLAGSTLPPCPGGCTWRLALHDEFDGNSLSGLWRYKTLSADACALTPNPVSVSGGILNIMPAPIAGRARTFCNMVLYPQPPVGPGFWEIREKLDPAQWTDAGSCVAGDTACSIHGVQTAFDMCEALSGSQGGPVGGTAGDYITFGSVGGINGKHQTTQFCLGQDLNFHTYGMQWEPTTGIHVYMDGVNYPINVPSGASDNSFGCSSGNPCNPDPGMTLDFELQSALIWPTMYPSTGFQVDWVRYYTHN